MGLLAGSAASAQEYSPSFRPGDMTDQPAGDPNIVMVLGTPHLSQLPDAFRPEMVEPLIARLAEWKPTAIATEDTSGLICEAMRQSPARYGEAYESYCFDTTVATRETGLDVMAATAQADALAADWPDVPEPQSRRRLAALFLASGEPGSALVQWLRLSAAERRAEGILTPALVELLDKRMLRRNEADLVAAQLAARLGLERLWSVDDQATYMGPLADDDAFGAAITSAWDNAATKSRMAQTDALGRGLGDNGGLMAYYRALNAPEYGTTAYRSDWGAALAEPSAEGFGRRYVAYWETRNLRMVANIREVLGRRPGTRLLAIVGASHKAYYEAYLHQMRDVKLADVRSVLGP